ncbi:MAG: hypothetical protein R2713_15330 [Ilumatobacteraceae bacterium]
MRANRPTDPEWAASLEPGWQRRRMENFNNLVSGVFEPEDLVNDGWTDIIGKLLLMMRRGAIAEGTDPTEAVELADFEKMESIRARVETIVNDPNTAEALKPYYRQFCKRPCFHDEYLDTFNRPNVTLVDTRGQGVEAITERGIVANGVEYELDCIIFATGFEVGTEYTRRSGYELVGRDGITLTEKWADGACTLHGMFSRGFPNCFILSNIQSGFTANFPHMIDEQARHCAYVLDRAGRRGAGGGADGGGRAGVGRRDRPSGGHQHPLPRGVHAGLLQQRGQARERSLRNGSYGAGDRLHQGARTVARRVRWRVSNWIP